MPKLSSSPKQLSRSHPYGLRPKKDQIPKEKPKNFKNLLIELAGYHNSDSQLWSAYNAPSIRYPMEQAVKLSLKSDRYTEIKITKPLDLLILGSVLRQCGRNTEPKAAFKNSALYPIKNFCLELKFAIGGQNQTLKIYPYNRGLMLTCKGGQEGGFKESEKLSMTWRKILRDICNTCSGRIDKIESLFKSHQPFNDTLKGYEGALRSILMANILIFTVEELRTANAAPEFFEALSVYNKENGDMIKYFEHFFDYMSEKCPFIQCGGASLHRKRKLASCSTPDRVFGIKNHGNTTESRKKPPGRKTDFTSVTTTLAFTNTERAAASSAKHS